MKVYVLTKETTNVEIGESNVKVIVVGTNYNEVKSQFEREKVLAREELKDYDNLVERNGYKGDTWVIEEKENYFMLHIALQIRITHIK